MISLLAIFIPSLIGLAWSDYPEISILWSIVGSFVIAIFSQTWLFSREKDDLPLKYRLLRPSFTYQFYFVLANVVGGACYALNAAGYHFTQREVTAMVSDLAPIATAQSLMLLGHASVTVGMRLIPARLSLPRYYIKSFPAYAFVALSFLCLGVGAAASQISGLQHIGSKILQIGSVAILVEIAYMVGDRKVNDYLIVIPLLLTNLLAQILSGWKGLVLWTMITLGSLLYPIMPRRTILIGCAFGMFWLLFLHPFGLVYRTLTWQQGLDQKTATPIAIQAALEMSPHDRLENVWTLLVTRASEMYQFLKYLEYVPNRHPYFELDLINEAAIGLVPRLIWPAKPQLERLAMQRVYDAGIVLESTAVSAKSNLYQDAYLSWGWTAVILACLIFGSIIVLISQIAERLFGGYEIGTCLIFTSLFGDTVQSMPAFTFVSGSLGASVLVMFIIFVLGRATGWLVPFAPQTAQQITSKREYELMRLAREV